jgi:hypothetical protein
MEKQYDLQCHVQNLKILAGHMHDVPIKFYIHELIFSVPVEYEKQKHCLEIYNVHAGIDMMFQLLQIS